MNKVKISSGLAAVILLAGLYAGWATLLVVAVLMLIFCEMNESIKQTMTRVLTFFLAITLISVGWQLIVQGIDVVFSTIKNFSTIISSYAASFNILKLEVYFMTPVKVLVGIADDIISFGLSVVKLVFVITVLLNKPMKENVIVKKMNEFITKIVNYINSFEINVSNQSVTNTNVVNPTQEVTSNQNINV